MMVLKILVALFFIGMIVMNYVANALPLGGNNTGDLSDKYFTLFTPSGATFSIWGVIYLLMGLFVLNLFVQVSAVENQTLFLVLVIVSCILNVSWLIAWHYEKLLLSTVVMILFLIVLLSIMQRADLPLTKATFSVYAAWISVALIANIAIYLTSINISFLMDNQAVIMAIILIVATLIMSYMVFMNHNYYYGAVFLWAFFGIITKLNNTESAPSYLITSTTVLLVIQVLIILGDVIRENLIK